MKFCLRFLNVFKNLFFCFLLKLKISFLCNKKSDKIILCFDCLYDANQECIDAYSFFRFLQKNNIKTKYVVLKKNPIADFANIDKNIIVVKNKWEFVFKHTLLIVNSSYVFTSFGLFSGLDEIIKNVPSLKYILLGHGVTYLKTWLKDIYNNFKFDKILIPTKYTFELFKKNNLWNEGSFLLSGLPRWDKFKSFPLDNKNIFIFFSWRKTFLKSPAVSEKYFELIKEFCDELSAKIPNEINITFAWHHEILKNKLKIPKLNNRIKIISTNMISSEIQKSALLITDYSSVFWDFYYLDKPVVFYRFDFNLNYLSKVDIEIETEIKQNNELFLNYFYDKNLAIEKILKYLECDFVLEQELVLKINKYFFNHKDNCKQIAELLKLCNNDL